MASSVADAVAAGGVGFASKSRGRFGAAVRIFPLMASDMLMIRVVDCIRLYHGPQLGLIKVGMWYLLISILVELSFLFVWFYEQKELISVNTECPKSVYECF